MVSCEGMGVSKILWAVLYVNVHLGHSSRIDHFLFKFKDPIASPELHILHSNDSYNTSSHFPLLSGLQIPGGPKNPKKRLPEMTSRKIFDYSSADATLFSGVLEDELTKCNIDLLEADDALQVLQSSLLTASIAAIPYYSKKLNPKRVHRKRWTPELAAAVQESKTANFNWKAAGTPKDGHPLWLEKRKASKQVRSVQRREEAAARAKLRDDISSASASDQTLFHKLIRRQRSGTTPSTALLVDGSLITDEDAIRDEFAAVAERLGTPDSPDNCEMLLDCMRSLSDNVSESIVVTVPTVKNVICELKNKKAADRDGFRAEQLKLLMHSPDALALLTGIVNKVFTSCKIPPKAKTAYKSPVHKKGKDPRSTDNYRGITVTSIFGKLIEHLIRHYGQDDINYTQSGLQYGFTKNLSPNMASLIITEAIVESKETKKELYICSLDARKAFDIVPQPLLKFKLFNTPLNRSLWKLVDDLYYNNTEAIRWKGVDSREYEVCQGVRQGGVISTDLYKLFSNDRLLTLEASKLGLHIGATYLGATAVADDQLLLSNCRFELQGMMTICNDYATDHREILHPTKSVVVEHLVKPANKHSDNNTWTLGHKNVTVATEFEHLGLRWESKSSSPCVDDRIKTSRRTAYALMGIGLHGKNGLDPSTSLKLISTYVTPRLTYGLNATVLTKAQTQLMSQYHRTLIRQVQGLPRNASTTSIYLLSGTLPLEAILDLGSLALLGAIARLDGGNPLRDVAIRQLAMKTSSSKSWFSHVNKLGEKYGLDIQKNVLYPWPQNAWKSHTRFLVNQFWFTKLGSEAYSKTTLGWLIIHDLWLTSLHPLWSCVRGKPYQTESATIRATLLIGRYGLQKERVAFTKQEVDPLCPLCREEEEDVVHFITACKHRCPRSVSMITDLQDFYRQDNARPPSTPEEVSSAVLNGWGYRGGPVASMSSFSVDNLSLNSSSLNLNSCSTIIALKSKIIPANQLCNTICHRLHVHRDQIYNDILLQR